MSTLTQAEEAALIADLFEPTREERQASAQQYRLDHKAEMEAAVAAVNRANEVAQRAAEMGVQLEAQDIARKAHEQRRDPLKPLRVHSLAALRTSPPIRWLVQDIIAENTVNVIGGDGGIGKSALMIEMCRAFATGSPFLKHHHTTGGRVLYVAAEGAQGYGPRIRAAEAERGAMPDDSFMLIDDGVTLSTDPSVDQLARFVVAEDVSLVVLDTLSQLSGGSDENENSAMRDVMNRAKSIVDARPGAAVIIVAHVTKATGQLRGSGTIRNNVDAVWMLKGTRNAFNMSNQSEDGGKMRDGVPLKIRGLSLANAHGAVTVQSADIAIDELADPEGIEVIRSMAIGQVRSTSELIADLQALGTAVSVRTAERQLKALIAADHLKAVVQGKYRRCEP